METILIPVDVDIARAFQSVQPEQQQRIQALVNFWLRRAMNINKLQTTMDQISDEAETNGLTPEILESILNE
jgi:Holliday junction resolvase-like predicted endonuclease